MRSTLKHLAIKAAGWFFILLGIVGIFLPVLQGILFLLIGLTLLSAEYVWAHRLLAHLKTRFPKLHEQFKNASQRASAWMHGPRAGPPNPGDGGDSPKKAGKGPGSPGAQP